jgi:RNA recognition motif-containing protein
MKRIYVGNLAPGTEESTLLTAFEHYGPVAKAGIVCDRETGEPRGFGFVLMRDHLQADEAIQALDGSKLNGQSIRVLEALPPEGKRNQKRRPDSVRNALDRFRAF